MQMPQTLKRTEELLQKANNLPLCPGVYIMKDKNGKVIYVGKSRKLKNRVSQYFQNSKKNFKTARMVASAEDFDYVVSRTEIEALTLENTLIKQHSPKYNIKLKDAKSYPYIKVTDEEYPRIVFTRTRTTDKGKYFGPFSGTSVVYSVLDILHKSLGIPSCKRQFPRDIGKERPCLYYQMGQCCGLCTGKVSAEEYKDIIRCATDVLRGNTSGAIKELKIQMMRFAEDERFETAAKCRDTIAALERLHQKQNVVASPETEMDVFGLWHDDYCTCISCVYVRGGAVIDKNDYLFGTDTVVDDNALCAFLVEHYMRRDMIPKEIIVSFELEDADREMLEAYFFERAGRHIAVRRPERGNTKQLCDTVVSNAEQKANQVRIESQKDEDVLVRLAQLLKLESVPSRIEAYDISNIGNENITAGMVVYINGKQSRADYRSFNIKTVDGADDYASMREALTRRIKHLLEDDNGSFAEYPDLLLIDGGKGHVSVVREVLDSFSIDLPVFGMVKDDYHKTRALCNETQEINIAKDRGLFTLIYKIQEEVHRFTVGRTTNAKRSTYKRSSLENINGIGPAKAKKLLNHFGTLAALKSADIEQISIVSGITEKDAQAVYAHFNKK
jgi:excinuclease ABC subunit C